MISKRWQFNHQDAIAWVHKALIQLIPVVLIYLTPLMADLGTQGHIFTFKDFIPSNFTTGAMVLYLINRLYDALQRLYAGKQ